MRDMWADRVAANGVPVRKESTTDHARRWLSAVVSAGLLPSRKQV